MKRLLSAGFKLLISLLATWAVLTQCGVFGGKGTIEALRYYTLLSNVLVAGVLFYEAVIKALFDKPVNPFLKGMTTMGITVTGLVYHFLLSKIYFVMGNEPYAWANIILHYIVPIGCVIDWLFNYPKGVYRPSHPIKWLILPYSYFLLAVIMGFSGAWTFFDARFPYFFIDFDKLGPMVFLYVLLLTLFFLLLGYVFYFTDKLLSRKLL